MKKRVIFFVLVSMLIMSTLYITQSIIAPTTQSEAKIFPDYFLGMTLQQAVDNVTEGDWIVVRTNATPYIVNLNINKSLTLEGGLGDGDSILAGGGTGTVVTINASNVMLRNFVVRGGDVGIKLEFDSSNNVLDDNTITYNNDYGIYISRSYNHTLRNNNILDNWGEDFYLAGGTALAAFVHDIDGSNTIDGRPIYYWVNRTNDAITAGDNAGFVAIVNSANITVSGQNVARNSQGILFAYTTNSTIESNFLSYNEAGIELLNSDFCNVKNNKMINNGIGIHLTQGSDNNTIASNTIQNSQYIGICLASSNNNVIHRNNFIDNYQQRFALGTVNVWDNDREGNFWSDYEGVDDGSGVGRFGEPRVAGDGIGDTETPHPTAGGDYYPLMEHWRPIRKFGIYWNTALWQTFTLESDSTIASPDLSRQGKYISFTITSGTHGLCNVTIPRDMADYPFNLSVNGNPWTHQVTVNQTHHSIYFTYTPSLYYIRIEVTQLHSIDGDINNDCKVDIFDAILLANVFGFEEDSTPKPLN